MTQKHEAEKVLKVSKLLLFVVFRPVSGIFAYTWFFGSYVF